MVRRGRRESTEDSTSQQVSRRCWGWYVPAVPGHVWL